MTDHVDGDPTIAARLAALEARETQTRDAVRELVTRLAWASLDRDDSDVVLAALDAPAPDAAPVTASDKCPKCGNNRQVWRNQITGRLRCHRVGCEADLPAPVTASGGECPDCGSLLTADHFSWCELDTSGPVAASGGDGLPEAVVKALNSLRWAAHYHHGAGRPVAEESTIRVAAALAAHSREQAAELARLRDEAAGYRHAAEAVMDEAERDDADGASASARVIVGLQAELARLQALCGEAARIAPPSSLLDRLRAAAGDA